MSATPNQITTAREALNVAEGSYERAKQKLRSNGWTDEGSLRDALDEAQRQETAASASNENEPATQEQAMAPTTVGENPVTESPAPVASAAEPVETVSVPADETLQAENQELRKQLARAEKLVAQVSDEAAEKIYAAKVKEAEAVLDASTKIGRHRRGLLTQEETIRAAAAYDIKKKEAALAEWPDEVEELTGVLSPVLPFSPEFLPRSVRPWATDVSERMGTPLDFPGIAMIVALAGVTGRRAFVYPRALDKEWKEAICLSGGIVAESGGLKTPTSKAILDPVNATEAEFRRQHQAVMAQYEKERAAYERSVAENKKDSTKAVLPEPVEPAGARRLITNDATPEAIHTLMDRNPEGVLYYRDELAGWVADMSKKGYESMKSIFLAGMNGDDAYTMDRIGRGEVTAIMCISIWGHFQPMILRNFLNLHQGVNEEDGTVQRFSLMIWPDDVKRKGLDRPSDRLMKSQVARVISTIAKMKENTIAFHFDKEAQAIFNEWLDQHMDKVGESTGSIRSHLSKYPGALAKVAALYQLVDLVTDTPHSLGKVVSMETGKSEEVIGPPDLSGDRLIDAQHLKMAVKLFEYLESHMRRVYNCVVTPHEWAEQIIGQHILDGDLHDGFTGREIQRKRWAGMDDRTSTAGSALMIDFALENLEEKGWIRRQAREENMGPGRPTVRWEINPKLDDWAEGKADAAD